MTQASTLPVSSVRPDPRQIIVPRKHGRIVIEPPLARLQRSLDFPVPGTAVVFGRSLEQLRHDAREHFLEQAIRWADQTDAPPPSTAALDKPWIITGHQIEFYHAGVWAKVLAADELAKRSDAIAFDLLVDHDVVEHLGFDIPVRSGDSWQRKRVQWADPTSVPADGLHAPTPAQFEQWDAEIARHPQTQTDSLAFFLSALRPAGDEVPYTQWLPQARAKFERAMNLNVHHIPTSLACSGKTWEGFVHAWADHAGEWISVYNRHLAAYRASQGIKNPQHPMPDLTQTSDTLELPFWIYKLGESRQRLILSKPADVTSLLESGAIIRPRALALTMFVRLFLSDLFIHGIGGALYDQITDGLLQELFGIVPSYGCVSAAWLLPLGRPLESLDDIAALKWRRHHLAHNPQLAIDPFTALKPDIAEAIRDRQRLIDQIAASLATHRKEAAAERQRHEWFLELHALNRVLREKSPGGKRLLADLDHQLEGALRAREEGKVLLWREYFFGLHTMDSLKKLIDAIHAL